jgi:serine/threonine-protein kinase PpkA
VTPADLIRMHISDPIPRLEGPVAGYQPILDRLLAKKPESRFQSARELFGAVAV